MNALDRELTINQAAEMMGVTPNAIYLRIRRESIAQENPHRYPTMVRLSEIVRVLDGDPIGGAPEVEVAGPMPNISRLLTYHETADYMGISISTLSNRIAHGKRPRPFRKGPGGQGKWMFRLSDIIDAIDNPNARTPEECEMGRILNDKKKAITRSKFDIQYEVIQARCPARNCGAKFNIKVVKGSCKWIYCHLHQDQRNNRSKVSDTGYDHNYI